MMIAINNVIEVHPIAIPFISFSTSIVFCFVYVFGNALTIIFLNNELIYSG